jgi:Mg-chelatase subunit ChlD
MTVLTASLLAAASFGLALRGGSRLLRLAALALLLAFAVVSLADARGLWSTMVPPVATAATTSRTDLLRAAAGAAPRVADLQLAWQPGAPPLAPTPAPLGAAAVQPLPLPLRPESLQVTALSVPMADRPLLLRVDPIALAADAAPTFATLPAQLVVRHAGVEVWQAPISLATDRPALPMFVPKAAGEHQVELRVEVAGTSVIARGAFQVAPPPAVLVLEPSGLAAEALRAQGLTVDTANGPPADWRRYGACVLATPLLDAAQQDVVAAALDGLGVFVLPGGFQLAASPLRALLPLSPRPPAAADERGNGRRSSSDGEPPRNDVPPPKAPPTPPPVEPAPGPVAPELIEVDKRAIAMVLVVDRSGSMGNLLPNGLTKMSYAKSSALQTARALGEGDQVGLVTFGNKEAGRVELPMVAATDLARVRAGIEGLRHQSELTYLLSGLRLGRQLLQPAAAAVKHIVVVSDGEFMQGEELALRAEAHAMRDDRISLSVISIIDRGTDPGFLQMAESLTQDGAGQFLPTDDPTKVPMFMVAEVTRALQRVGREPRSGDGPSTAPKPTPRPPAPRPPAPQPEPKRSDAEPALPARLAVRAVQPSPLLLPRPADAWPTLGAAVAGEAPLDAQVLLVAGDEGWPLLAFGNRGLGRVAAFGAELFGPAGEEFRADAAFPARFAQWLSSLLPPAPPATAVPLLTAFELTPPVPTPAEREAWTALAGQAPVVTPEVQPPLLARTRVDAVATWAPWLLVGVVLLALLERLWVRRRLLAGGES